MGNSLSCGFGRMKSNFYLHRYKEYEQSSDRTSNSKMGKAMLSKQFMADVLNSTEFREQVWDNYAGGDHIEEPGLRTIVEHIMELDESTQVIQRASPDNLYHGTPKYNDDGSVGETFDYDITKYGKAEGKVAVKAAKAKPDKVTKKIMKLVGKETKGEISRGEFVSGFSMDVYRKAIGLKNT